MEGGDRFPVSPPSVDASGRLDQLPGFDGMAPVTGIVMLAVHCVAAITSAAVFYRRRNLQPCLARRPSQMVLLFVGAFGVSATYLAGLVKDVACVPGLYLPDVGFLLVSSVYVVRVLSFYFNHRVVRENRSGFAGRLQEPGSIWSGPPRDSRGGAPPEEWEERRRPSWFAAHRYLIASPCVDVIHLALFALAMLPLTVRITELSPAASWTLAQCFAGKEVVLGWNTVSLGIAAAMQALCLLGAQLTSRIGGDTLGIRLELTVTTALTVTSAVLVAVLSWAIQGVEATRYPIKIVVTTTCATLILVTAFVVPVRLSYTYGRRLTADEAGWAEANAGKGLDVLLRTPAGRDVFRRFCESELSTENILFHEDVERFKRHASEWKEAAADGRGGSPTPAKKIFQEGKRVLQTYLLPWSPHSVNARHDLITDVRGRFSQATAGNLSSIDPNVFDEVHKHIYRLMSTDVYPRFLRSQFAKFPDRKPVEMSETFVQL